jgi:hypothetical protein
MISFGQQEKTGVSSFFSSAKSVSLDLQPNPSAALARKGVAAAKSRENRGPTSGLAVPRLFRLPAGPYSRTFQAVVRNSRPSICQNS